MSLYKKPGSGYWYMNIYRGRGMRRIQRSTGTKDLAEARIIEQGFSRVNRGETSRERMVQLLDSILGPEEKGMPLEQIGAFYERAVESEKRKLGAKTLKTRVNLAGRFALWAKENTRARTADDVTVAVAWQFNEHIGRASDVTNKTRNAYMSELGTIWAMLMKRGKAKENPWSVPRVQRDRDQEQTGRAWTHEEEERIFKAAQEVGHEWFEACVIARYTGLRFTDVKSLKWDEVDLKQRIISLAPVKTKRHGIFVKIPIHPKLAAVLAERERMGTDGRYGAPEPQPKDGSTSQWVLPERHAHDGKKFFKGDMAFSKILEKAGVVEPEGSEYKLSFHCWRHTFDTRLSEAGVDQETRMAMTGHTVKETEKIYNHDWSRFEKAIAAMK